MQYSFQPSGLTEIDVGERCVSRKGPAELGVAKVGPAKVGPDKVGPAKVGAFPIGSSRSHFACRSRMVFRSMAGFISFSLGSPSPQPALIHPFPEVRPDTARRAFNDKFGFRGQATCLSCEVSQNFFPVEVDRFRDCIFNTFLDASITL